MARLLLTEDLIADVRSCLDEVNRSRIDDDLDIIPALNRGLDHGASILARHYDDPLLTLKTVTSTSNEVPIPVDAFEERVEKIELQRNSGFYDIDRISTRDISKYETVYSTNSLPLRWAQVGKTIRLLPGNSTGDLRIHYLRTPLPLGKTMGRVTRVGADFLVIANLSSSVTTNADLETSYINVVNPETGDIRGSLQVKRINGDRLEFKTTPDKTTFLGYDILTLATIGVEEEDRLSLSGSTCTPFMKRPLSNFLISFAEGEIRRKLGEDTEVQLRAMMALKEDVERSWSGRESTLRVDTRGGQWNRGLFRRHSRRFWR